MPKLVSQVLLSATWRANGGVEHACVGLLFIGTSTYVIFTLYSPPHGSIVVPVRTKVQHTLVIVKRRKATVRGGVPCFHIAGLGPLARVTL